MSNNTEWQVEQIPDTKNEAQPTPPQVFYDGSRYYLDNQKEYIPINEGDYFGILDIIASIYRHQIKIKEECTDK